VRIQLHGIELRYGARDVVDGLARGREVRRTEGDHSDGAPLGSSTTWWKKVTPPLAPDFTAETGVRTFALSELMNSRTEDRATLLVHKDHVKVRSLYESWGYETVGDCIPFEGAPVLCAMMLALR
jgi:hypothetical protein